MADQHLPILRSARVLHSQPTMSAGRTKLDSLSAVAELLRDSLKRSQVVDDNMLEIIESCNRRLSSLELEVGLLPIQVRHTHAFRIAHQNIEKTLAAAESILSQFDVARKVEAKIDRGPHEDLVSYLEAVDELLANVEYFSYNRSNDGVLNHARSVLSAAMDKLGEEFRSLLVQHSKSEDPAKLSKYLPQPQASRNANRSSTELTSPGSPGARLADLPLVLIPPDIIPNLQEMAHRLIAATHSQQCLAIYTEIRASALEQTLCKLGFEELTKDEVETLQWEILKEKIGSWNRCMCIVVKLLYSAERDLCKEVFRGLDPYESRCFLKVTINSFKSLLSTGNAITQNKRSPNKLFALLDMYDTMHDLLPEIEANFYGNESYEVFQAAIDFIQMLAQTTKETFDDFLERVEKDASKTLLQDGSVHPFTNYVIKYVKFLLDYQTTLKQLFEDDDQGDKSSSYFAKSTAKIMQLLLSNLDGKAKQYTDLALGHIFLMNNIHYIVQFVRGSEAKDLLSDNWIDRHRLLVQQHAQGYKQSTWGKVLPCLSDSSGISSSVIKERFKIFNTLFEEVHRKQSQWTIPEAELREAVQLAVAEVLLPAYRRRYNAILENSKNPQKYIKYKPEDLKQLKHRKQSQWTIPEAELREAVQLAVAEVLLPAYRRRYNAILENSKNPQKYIKYKPEDLKQLKHRKQSQWTIPEAELREAVQLAVAEVLLPAYRRRYNAILENSKNPQKYIKYKPEDLKQLKHRKQSQWTIPEAELREAVQLAVAEVLLPAYRRRYNAILENSKNPQKYIKYKPEDLKQLIGEFFELKNKSSRR